MARATLRFYQELNEFLPRDKRGQELSVPLIGTPSVKDVIESYGVPHTEVDLVLVNNESVDFSYRVHPGDRVAVYPVFESFDVSEASRVRAAPLRNPRFILDVHLGTLARLLRLMGFDTLYRNDYDDADIVDIALDSGRIILTRDQGLLMRRRVTHGYWLRSQDPIEQAAEVLRRFDLAGLVQPLIRCPRCNGRIRETTKELVWEKLPPKTRDHYDTFYRCEGCGQVYWRGSHWRGIQEKIDNILRNTRRFP